MKVENGRSILTSKQKHQLISIITLKIPMFPFFFNILNDFRLFTLDSKKIKRPPHSNCEKIPQ